jgi:hypothetical protein
MLSEDPTRSYRTSADERIWRWVLVFDQMVSDRTFLPKDQLDEYEHLEFVSRARTPKSRVTPYATYRGIDRAPCVFSFG